MKRTNWFDRVFPPQTDNGVFPCILERLSGTAARLQEKINAVNVASIGTTSTEKTWSIKKEIGHLIDLEPLWLARALEILADKKDLKVADLGNTKTHETDHDAKDFDDLIQDFRKNRQALMTVLEDIMEQDLEKAAVHPRLGTPMTLIDLAYFVAEHDDHHLAQISILRGNSG
jgi:uncharacterized damage-inducible protein DinB